MKFSSEIGLFQNPECLDSSQNPVQILEKRILYFGNPPLKSKTCARIRFPNCFWVKRILENVFLSINTKGYDEVQIPILPPPKGEGVLPARGGGDTSFPWAILLGRYLMI